MKTTKKSVNMKLSTKEDEIAYPEARILAIATIAAGVEASDPTTGTYVLSPGDVAARAVATYRAILDKLAEDA